ncbi:MAG: hypothetical protein RI983_1737 [Bacteroidota bacterium]
MSKTCNYCVKGFFSLLPMMLTNCIAAQCVFVSVNGPKCAGEGTILANFSRSPYQVEWILNDSVVQKSKATLSGSSTTVVSGTHGIAIENNGNIYISDTLNNRIVVYTKILPMALPLQVAILQVPLPIN